MFTTYASMLDVVYGWGYYPENDPVFYTPIDFRKSPLNVVEYQMYVLYREPGMELMFRISPIIDRWVPATKFDEMTDKLNEIAADRLKSELRKVKDKKDKYRIPIRLDCDIDLRDEFVPTLEHNDLVVYRYLDLWTIKLAS